MDVFKAIRDLIDERKRIEQMIAYFEGKQVEHAPAKSRRGRKAMSAEERVRVSERMKRYWELRRVGRSSASEGSPD
jgi:hypothetical protein